MSTSKDTPQIMKSPLSGKYYLVTKQYKDGRAKEKLDITELLQKERTLGAIEALEKIASKHYSTDLGTYDFDGIAQDVLDTIEQLTSEGK